MTTMTQNRQMDESLQHASRSGALASNQIANRHWMDTVMDTDRLFEMLDCI